MKKQFAEFGSIMAEAREVLAVIWRKQQNEIGVVNEEHRAMHDAYQQKQESVYVNFIITGKADKGGIN